jgi:hypothetical protein
MELRSDLAGGRPGGFTSDRAAREAWFANRDRFMGRGNPGTRPPGWWRFESPVPKPVNGPSAHVLYDHGLLDADERADLEACWRQDEAEAFENATTARDYFRTCRQVGVPYSLRRAWRGATAADKAEGEFRDVDARQVLRSLEG